MKEFIKFAKQWPGAVYPITVVCIINILAIFVFDLTGTIYGPAASMLIWIAIGFQWLSLRKQINQRIATRREADKKSFAKFMEYQGLHGANGVPGDIHFLSPFKEKWYNPSAWYRSIRGITRLSLFRYGDTDEYGSYIKLPVDKKVLFQLLLMDCADTPNPDRAVKGIAFIRDNCVDSVLAK
jgi:hypothetical protein